MLVSRSLLCKVRGHAHLGLWAVELGKSGPGRMDWYSSQYQGWANHLPASPAARTQSLCPVLRDTSLASPGAGGWCCRVSVLLPRCIKEWQSGSPHGQRPAMPTGVPHHTWSSLCHGQQSKMSCWIPVSGRVSAGNPDLGFPSSWQVPGVSGDETVEGLNRQL